MPSRTARAAWTICALACLLSACHRPPATGARPAGGAPGASNTASQHQAAPETTADWDGFQPDAGPVLTGHSVKLADLSPTEIKYGVAPKRISGVVYQDDVVLLEDGDKRIRELKPDGLNWTLDGTLPQIANLQKGQILFATSRCVGKVLAVSHDGANVAVVLGPVQLTDLIKSGNFHYSQPVDLNSVVAYSAPDYPGAINSQAAQQMEAQDPQASSSQDSGLRHVSYYVISSQGEWRDMKVRSRATGEDLHDGVRYSNDPRPPTLVPIQLPGLPGVPLTQLPQVPVTPADVQRLAPPATINSVNGMTQYTCSIDCGGLGLKLYQHKGGVQVWVNVIFHLISPTLDFDLSVGKGGVNAHVNLTGTSGLTVEFVASADDALKSVKGNLSEVGSVPMDATFPLAGMGVPLTAEFQQSLYLKTGFSARNSVLRANGEFTATGGISMSYVKNKWSIPPLKLTLTNSLANAVAGVSMGINSFVLAIDQRMLVGVGGLGFASGPYVNLVSNITALKQASQVKDCRQGTFGMEMGGGIGWSIPKVVAKVINFFLDLVKIDPIPSSGYIVKLPKNISLVSLREQVPDKCAGG
jgi:hypothetical protein